MEPIALIGIAITLTASLWKVFQIIGGLEKQLMQLKHEIELVKLTSHDEVELLEATTNGVRERMEHINTRLSNWFEKQQHSIDDIEGWLQKNTVFEKRTRN